MLSKKHRLTKREDFLAAYSKGLYFKQAGLAIKYRLSGQPMTRLGFSISKNFSKKAVKRNRARRILQEVCHHYLKELKVGFDIVVILKSGQKDKDIEFKKVEDILKQIFTKANLLT